MTQTYLRQHGVKPSVQRIAIMEYLLAHHTHPTIDDIYNALHPSIATLSKTTVYNTLKLLVDHGAAKYVGIDEKNARYDGIIEPHAHFRCKHCGCIIDVPMDVDRILPKNVGFSIDQTYFYIDGVCDKCLKKGTK